MPNPCLNCKRYPNCPNPCYPRKDYLRHLKKRKKKKMTITELEILFRDAAERCPVPWIPAGYAEQMGHLTLVWVKLLEGDEWKYQIATCCRGIFFPLYWGDSTAIKGNPKIEWFKPDDGRLEALLAKVQSVNFPSWEISSMDKAFKEILGG